MATSLASGHNDAARPSDRNRAELDRVLGSDAFRRSPKLSRLLLYLCEKSLQGLAGEITEYGIGIDVLGRDHTFDPQRDALVRVDTHHLRKRLKEYYAASGSEHEIHIVIPSGRYAPEFIPGPNPMPEKLGDISPPADEADIVVTPAEEPLTPTPAPTLAPAALAAGNNRKLAGAAAGLILLALAAWWVVAAGREKTPAGLTNPALPGSIGLGSDAAIRIASGDRTAGYTDHLGRLWMSDRFFQGGATFRRGPIQIQRTLDSELFLSGREGQFVYNIPLRAGTYELHLYFAETGVPTESLRGVSMAINSVPSNTVDIASDAGAINTATIKVFKNISPAKDGILHLTFLGTGPSFLNAIEILPGVPGKMLPIRLTARDSIYRDHLGQIWMPDESSAGGRRSTSTARVEGATDQGLYQTDRVGHFTYSIPVVEGSRYTVRLYFTEPWFNQADSRIFDVYCNGTTLLKNFDIFREAGGGKRSIVRVFHGVPASPQGKLDLSFVPVVNYALVNAIEVIEE